MMYKKLQKENNNKCESDSVENDAPELPEDSLLEVIGALNLKRWKSLKNVFCCNTDEDFVRKLLDIAQDYLNSTVAIDDEIRLKKQTKKILKDNNKQKPKETNQENVIQCQNHDKDSKGITFLNTNGNILEENEDKKRNITKTEEPIIVPKKQNLLPSIKVEVEEQCKEPPSNNFDVIKIKLCYHCNTHHLLGNCPINVPHYIYCDAMDHNLWMVKYHLLHEEQYKIFNSKTPTDNSSIEEHIDKYSYSVTTLPECLYLDDLDDFGVYAKQDLEPFSQFGPLIGKVVKAMDIPEDIDMRYIWEIVTENGNVYFNTEDNSVSNWVKYMRPAPKKEDKNLTVVPKENKIFFVSVKFIKAGDELLYWQDSPSLSNKKKMEKTACGGCNIEFNHPHYYRIHCSLFHDVRYSLTIKKFYCKVCGAAVLGKENIIKHAAELHNGQGAYQCQFCKKFFLRLNYLEMHRTYGCSANPHRSKPLCDFCGRKFCQPQKLKMHIKRMHGDFEDVLKEFQCKSCLKILGSRAALQRHVKEVHQKHTEGLCSCSRCGKTFQNKSNLKIHMLTHSGIKPFKCSVDNCNAAFTTKQCLQFHYKKVHNFTDDNMPKIERSIDFTFQAYSGNVEAEKKGLANARNSKNAINNDMENRDDSDNESLRSQNMDDPEAINIRQETEDRGITISMEDSNSLSLKEVKNNTPTANIKILSKGSKKWISDDTPSNNTPKLSDIYSVERLSKDDFSGITLQEPEIYDRKLSTITDFTRHDASNASLLVEAALDSVCNEPNIEIDVSTTPNCSDSLVNNLYNLTQPDNLGHVTYNDAAPCINDSRDINLISPSVNDHVSVTDDLNDELRDNNNIGMNYSNFSQNDFSPPHTPDVHRSNFVRNYINSLSPPHNTANYEQKNLSPVPSPPRFDFGHSVNADRLSSDDSNGMAVQNLSVHHPKSDIQLDLSIYKTSYKPPNQDFRKIKFEGATNDPLEQDHVDVINQSDLSDNIQSLDVDKNMEENQEHVKYSDELATDIRSKFDIDLDIRLKNYDNSETDSLRQRNHGYESVDFDFRNKTYELIEAVESRNKQYDIDSDFRTDRNFEPLILNSSELQGLDMSARNFHNYTNINRYHHLYPEVDRVDLRLNYSPPPPSYTHADILRVVSLDLTSPGRHSVDLSFRNHPLHQINSRLLTEHSLQTNPHRLLDQPRLISTDLTTGRHLTTDRIIPEPGSRILTDHTTSRILTNEPLTSNHLLNSDQGRIISDDSRIMSDQSRLLDQTRLLTETRIANGSVSPVQSFSGYSVTQNPYHPTPIAPRPHVTSPTSTPYHYPTYY